MRLNKWTSCLIVAVLFGIGGSQAMADDLFLKIDGIQGESVDALHPNEIQLQSYTTGVVQPGTIFSAGKAEPRDFAVVAFTSIASPKLFALAASGNHLRTVVLSVRSKVPNQVPFEYLKITLREVIVTAVTLGGAAGTGRGTDNYAFAYSVIEFLYTPRNADGTAGSPVQSAWDVKASKVL